MGEGILYVVATPIGNLGDISQRGLTVLKTVQLIAAEDTRHSKRLLQHYGITTPVFSLHEFNEQKRLAACLRWLQEGKDIALISDAGTPLISDPGYWLIKNLREARIKIIPIPGPCAAITALSAAGLPTARFVFEGFLSARDTERRRQLADLAQEERTIIFYEAPHRILKLCHDIAQVFSLDRQVVLAKELTKTFETFFYGTAAEASVWLENAVSQKGEWVVLVAGASPAPIDNELAAESLRVMKILSGQLPLKQAVELAAEITGEKRNKLYARALQIRQ